MILPVNFAVNIGENGLLFVGIFPNGKLVTSHTVSPPPQTPTNTQAATMQTRVSSRFATFGNQFPGNIINHCNVPGTVALTFDDGPSPHTSHVLDILDRHGAKATFFVNGDNFSRGRIDDHSTPWPETLQRMHQSGHQIGSHTWSHVDLTAVSSWTRQQEISDLEQAFVNLFGWYPVYVRPPYGSCEHECQGDLAWMGYHVVTWDIDTKDYANDSPEAIYIAKETFSNALSMDPSSNSYIALSHDVHVQTAYTLTEYMLDTLGSRGYRAVTVGECLGDPAENWYRSDMPDATEETDWWR